MMEAYIDMHCDTLLLAARGANDIWSQDKSMLDLRRMQEGGQMAQFFAVFFPDAQSEYLPEGWEMPDDETYFAMLRQLLLNSVAAHSNAIALAGSAAEIRKNRENGKMSAILTVEDGRAVNGNMERLRQFYDEGVRAMTLTWNYVNCFGSPNSMDPQVMQQGLTGFGKEAVGVMNELGMIIDVSHLSDGGFRDVAALSKKPFIASHSNCRALSPHPRNLSDGMIRTLADSGGCVGLNFCPAFLLPEARGTLCRVEDLCAHVLHMLQVGGEDCIALGTDFDGIEGSFEVGQPTEMHLLFEALSAHGLTLRQLEKFASGNILRVMDAQEA